MRLTITAINTKAEICLRFFFDFSINQKDAEHTRVLIPFLLRPGKFSFVSFSFFLGRVKRMFDYFVFEHYTNDLKAVDEIEFRKW